MVLLVVGAVRIITSKLGWWPQDIAGTISELCPEVISPRNSYNIMQHPQTPRLLVEDVKLRRHIPPIREKGDFLKYLDFI